MSVSRTLRRKLSTAINNGDWNLVKKMQRSLEKVLEKPDNLILLTDGYKYSHHRFYGSEMTKMISYVESRGGKFDKTLFYGLQILIKKHLEGIAIIAEEVDEAYEYLGTKLGIYGRDDVFDRSKFDYIVEKHGGKLPIKIMAVPEGTVVDTNNVLLTIESLDPECAWLTNFLESIILQIWYPISVATLSREVKLIVKGAFKKCTSYDEDTVEFLVGLTLNDFGFRGATCPEAAGIGGSAHLVNFEGSDTVIANQYIRDYYNTDKIVGKSIPATEHSIMTLKGEDGELEMMRRVLTLFPTGPVACVSDSFHIIRAVRDYWGTELKELILYRPSEPGNQLIIRPDSGDVIRTLKEIFDILFEKFGYTENEKGYKVLPPQIRVIQGDGVNFESIKQIYAFLEAEKISPENLALGMGGKLLQSEIDRDMQKFATKACAAIVDGKLVDVVKSPTEMDADGNLHKSFKTSKKGTPKLVLNEDMSYRTAVPADADYHTVKDELILVLEYGVLVKEHTFEEIQIRAAV